MRTFIASTYVSLTRLAEKHHAVDLGSSEDEGPLRASLASATGSKGAGNSAAVQLNVVDGGDTGEENSDSPDASDPVGSDDAELSDSGEDLDIDNVAAVGAKLAAEVCAKVSSSG